MSTYSNWREDLIEVIDTPTTEKKAEKKVKETKVNNKVVINPTFKEAVAEMGGQILEVAEVDGKKDTAGTKEDPQIKSKEKRAGMIKRQVLLKKLQAVRAGGGTDITAGYEPEGEMVEDYETKKTGEVLAAFKRDPKVRKRFEKTAKKEGGPGSAKNRAADDMLQTAKDTAKRKGDTSKSDDRYAYESAVLDANTKISNKEKRDKLEKELASLTKRAKAMKKHGSGYHPFLHGEEVEKVDEGIMKMVKKVVRSKRSEKKAEKAMDAGARAKRQLARQVHAKYVSGSEDNVPDDIRDHYEVNERTLASYIPSDRQGEVHRANLDYTKAQLKKREDESTKNRGDLSKRDAGKMAKERLRTKKISSLGEGKGYQPEIEVIKSKDLKKKERESKLPPHLQGDAIGKMKKAFATEDKAFNFVLDKIRKEVGKDGYVSKNNPRKPQSAADKAKVRAHQAKVDKENAAERAKDPSQGRYPKG